MTDRTRIERLQLFVAGATLAVTWIWVAREFWLALALGALLGGVNLRLLLGSTEKLFGGQLQGGLRWSAVFLLRFVLFAGALGFAIASGLDPAGLLLGFSTVLPAVVVGAAWSMRGGRIEAADKGSRV